MRKSAACCAIFLLALALPSCLPGREDQAGKLEKEIRAAVISESAALASLTCIFRIAYTSFKGRLFFSDEIYVQHDEAAMDYGYRIDENSIRVVFEDNRNVLRVRLPKGELLGVNRYTLKTEKTHDDYHPEADVEAEINRELESLKKEYGERALREASRNIENFFRIVAAKYTLELDFGLE
jgi:hypothetical protein